MDLSVKRQQWHELLTSVLNHLHTRVSGRLCILLITNYEKIVMRDSHFIDESRKMSEKRNRPYLEEGKLLSNLTYDKGTDVPRH